MSRRCRAPERKSTLSSSKFKNRKQISKLFLFTLHCTELSDYLCCLVDWARRLNMGTMKLLYGHSWGSITPFIDLILLYTTQVWGQVHNLTKHELTPPPPLMSIFVFCKEAYRGDRCRGLEPYGGKCEQEGMLSSMDIYENFSLSIKGGHLSHYRNVPQFLTKLQGVSCFGSKDKSRLKNTCFWDKTWMRKKKRGRNKKMDFFWFYFVTTKMC